jgi:hypothetical protein
VCLFVLSFLGFSGSFQCHAVQLNRQIAIHQTLIHTQTGMVLTFTTLSMTEENYQVGVAAGNLLLVVIGLSITVCNRVWSSDYNDTDGIPSMSLRRLCTTYAFTRYRAFLALRAGHALASTLYGPFFEVISFMT